MRHSAMSPLSATDLLEVWEFGEQQSPFERALTILAVACPELTSEHLASLSLGQRDRRLFLLHQWHFGPNLQAIVVCPQCHERLEFSIRMPDFESDEAMDAGFAGGSFSAAGFDVTFRLPNSRDLISAGACADLSQARQHLIDRCLQTSETQDVAVNSSELPAAVLEELATRLAWSDPWQEVLLDMSCPKCGHGWQPLLDIATFLWEKLAAQAKCLLYEVHTLARAYGWREADILAMSTRRRRSYLELAGL